MNDFYRISRRLSFTQSRIFFASNPEWWVLLLSISIWGILIFNTSSFSHSNDSVEGSNLVLCLPGGQPVGETVSGSLLRQENLWTTFSQSIVSGAVPWVMMICAMMFPMLKRSIRHVTYSVRKKNRNSGIFLFLLGYTLTWSLIGIVFHFIPILAWSVSEKFQFSINTYVLAALFFFLAAIISWLPERRVTLMKCELTVPIRLRGWNFLKDSVTYGIEIGMICLQMCWSVMIGLMFVQHHILIMLAAGFVLITERYLVAHDSKLIGYSWMFLGSIVLISGIISSQ